MFRCYRGTGISEAGAPEFQYSYNAHTRPMVVFCDVCLRLTALGRARGEIYDLHRGAR